MAAILSSLPNLAMVGAVERTSKRLQICRIARWDARAVGIGDTTRCDDMEIVGGRRATEVAVNKYKTVVNSRIPARR